MTTPKAPTDAERRLFNYTRTAAYLGVSLRTAKQLAADGHIRKVPIGHRVLFDKVDLDAYVERMKKAS